MLNERIELIKAELGLIKLQSPLTIAALDDLLANNTLSHNSKEYLIDLIVIASLVVHLAIKSQTVNELLDASVAPYNSKEDDQDVFYLPSLKAALEKNNAAARVLLRVGKKILNGELTSQFEAARDYDLFKPFKDLFVRVEAYRNKPRPSYETFNSIVKANQERNNQEGNDIVVDDSTIISQSTAAEDDPVSMLDLITVIKNIFESHINLPLLPQWEKTQTQYLTAINELKEDVLAQCQTKIKNVGEATQLAYKTAALTRRVMTGEVSQEDITPFLKAAEPFQRSSSTTALIIKNILGILACMIAGFAVAGIPGAAVGAVASISAGLAFTLWTKASDPIAKVECAATSLLSSSHCS